MSLALVLPKSKAVPWFKANGANMALSSAGTTPMVCMYDDMYNTNIFNFFDVSSAHYDCGCVLRCAVSFVILIHRWETEDCEASDRSIWWGEEDDRIQGHRRRSVAAVQDLHNPASCGNERGQELGDMGIWLREAGSWCWRSGQPSGLLDRSCQGHWCPSFQVMEGSTKHTKLSCLELVYFYVINN